MSLPQEKRPDSTLSMLFGEPGLMSYFLPASITLFPMREVPREAVVIPQGASFEVSTLTEMNFGKLPTGNGLSRLENRFMGDRDALDKLRRISGHEMDAKVAEGFGLVTSAPDEIDWDEELRLAIEERVSFSGDALTGLEANLRFSGPETIETKILARLSAWQNWIFQRPNAAGVDGALHRYGSGKRPVFDRRRV